MNILHEIFSSRARAEIFKLLFGTIDQELHIREIQRRSGFNDSTLRQELRKLERIDLLIARKDSNRIYYRANKSNPLYEDLRNLVLKTIGLTDVFKYALRDAKIQTAFVFGSIANGRGISDSDVDLFIIGEVSLREISKLLYGVSDIIGREINPYVMTQNEFKKRIKKGEHFISNVLNSPKLFIIGNKDGFGAMGE